MLLCWKEINGAGKGWYNVIELLRLLGFNRGKEASPHLLECRPFPHFQPVWWQIICNGNSKGHMAEVLSVLCLITRLLLRWEYSNSLPLGSCITMWCMIIPTRGNCHGHGEFQNLFWHGSWRWWSKLLKDWSYYIAENGQQGHKEIASELGHCDFCDLCSAIKQSNFFHNLLCPGLYQLF